MNALSDWTQSDLAECQDSPEDVYAAEGYFKNLQHWQRAHHVYIDERTNAKLHAWVDGREHTHTSGKTTHSLPHLFSCLFPLWSFRTCRIYTQGGEAHIDHLHHPLWWALHIPICTYGTLCNKKVALCTGLCAWIHLPTSTHAYVCNCAYVTSGNQPTHWKEGGRESPMPPVLSRGGGSSGWLSVHWDPPSEWALSARTNWETEELEKKGKKIHHETYIFSSERKNTNNDKYLVEWYRSHGEEEVEGCGIKNNLNRLCDTQR